MGPLKTQGRQETQTRLRLVRIWTSETTTKNSMLHHGTALSWGSIKSSLKDRIHTSQATTKSLNKPWNRDSRDHVGKRGKKRVVRQEMLRVCVHVCVYAHVSVYVVYMGIKIQ